MAQKTPELNPDVYGVQPPESLAPKILRRVWRTNGRILWPLPLSERA